MRHCFVHAVKGKVKGIVKLGNCCSGLNAEQFGFSQGQGMVGGTGHSQVIAGCDCPRFSSSCLTQPSNTISPCFGPQWVQNTAWSCAVKYHQLYPGYFGYFQQEKHIKNDILWHSQAILGCRLTERAFPQSVGIELQDMKDSSYWCVNIILHAQG